MGSSECWVPCIVTGQATLLPGQEPNLLMALPLLHLTHSRANSFLTPGEPVWGSSNKEHRQLCGIGIHPHADDGYLLSPLGRLFQTITPPLTSGMKSDCSAPTVPTWLMGLTKTTVLFSTSSFHAYFTLVFYEGKGGQILRPSRYKAFVVLLCPQLILGSLKFLLWSVAWVG